MAATADLNLTTVSGAATSTTFPISLPIRTKSETNTSRGLDANAHEPVSFLTLPSELRMKIYDHLIVPDGPVSIWEERTPMRGTSFRITSSLACARDKCSRLR